MSGRSENCVRGIISSRSEVASLGAAIRISLRFDNTRTGRGSSNGLRMQGRDQVGEAYHAAYDIGVLRISKVRDGYRRFWRRDQKQIVPLEFAPTDRITVVAQFHK